MLRGAAAEVEHQALAPDNRPQAQLEIAIGGLEHVHRAAYTVGQRGDACPRAALGVIQHRVGRGPQPCGAVAARELGEAQRPEAVGGQLRAQVRAPLSRLAHLRDDLLDRLLADHAWMDHDALLAQAAAVGRHRPRS